MYIPGTLTTKSQDLNQGDILANVYRPTPFVFRQLKPDGNSINHKFDDACLATTPIPSNLRTFSKVSELTFAIVISNSCDNYSGNHPIILAPIIPYKFREGKDAEDPWTQVRKSALNTGSPKLFYLTPNPAIGLVRSDALLAELFSFEPSILSQTLEKGRTRRVASLQPEAITHLQLHLFLLFCRNPREDLHWASMEDLQLKKAHLETRLAATQGDPRHAVFKSELEELKKHLGETPQS